MNKAPFTNRNPHVLEIEGIHTDSCYSETPVVRHVSATSHIRTEVGVSVLELLCK